MSQSNAQLLKAALYQDLEALLLPSGFHWQKGQGLRRKSATGIQRIVLLVDDIGVHSPSFALDILFFIRIQEVENLLQPYRAINPRDAQQAPTHVASIGQLVGDYRFKLLLARQEEIDHDFNQAGHYVTTLGLPYLDTYQDTARLDQLYNEAPSDLSVSMKALPVRAMVSLGLAKLTNRADWQARATSLYQEFDRWEGGSRDDDKAQFRSLVQELFKYSLA